jgi:hypothetical protein
MPNPHPKRYTRIVSVPLTDDQLARLDADVTAGTTRSDLIRAAIDGRLDDTVSRSLPGTLASPEALSALKARLSGAPEPVQPAHMPEIPEDWVSVSITTGALRQLQERPALDAALGVLRMAAETGDLDRDVLAELVAIRLGLRPDDRVMWEAGHLFREQAPAPKAHRSVQQHAE